MHYEELIWTAVPSFLKERILLIPAGSIEQHGLRLPVGVDTYLACAMCERVVGKVNGIIAPALLYGARSFPNSGGGDSFPGSVYIDAKILINYYINILGGYIQAGSRKIAVVNAHWENETFLIEAAECLKTQGLLKEVQLAIFNWWSVLTDAEIKAIVSDFAGWQYEHAGRVETSLMLHYHSGLVGAVISSCRSKDLLFNSNIYTYPPHTDIQENYGSLSNSDDATMQMGYKIAILAEKKIEQYIKRIFHD